jgi:SAM-dependent methyltransferase
VTDPGYAFAGAEHDLERRRLALLEECCDPVTFAQLDAIGVAEGWHCLDVGAGAGSVSRRLAARVGPGGRVVAADLNPRFLVDVPANVEVRELDVTRDELEPGAFDLVHVRLLLMHLPDPVDALRRMIGALRPGGWLLTTEGDWGVVDFGGHPDAPWATARLHELFALHEPLGRRPYFGRRMPGLVAGLGLDELTGELAGPMGLPGTAAFELYRSTVEGLRPINRAVGATDGELDRIAAVLDAPGATCSGVLLVCVRGRVPARPALRT